MIAFDINIINIDQFSHPEDRGLDDRVQIIEAQLHVLYFPKIAAIRESQLLKNYSTFFLRTHIHAPTHLHTQLRKDTPTIQSTSLSHKLFSVVQQNQFPFGSPEHLATFVVTTLFDALAGFLYSSEKSQIDINDDVRIWHNVYR